MSFSAPVFLFLFLPICLFIYLVADKRYRNLVLLAASLVFFAWGQWFYIPLMLLLIGFNYWMGQRIEQARQQEAGAQKILFASIAANLAVLIFFKLLVGYGAKWLPVLAGAGQADWLIKNPLPLGLSYIAFQVISYLFDMNNEVCDSEKNFMNFALYVLLFPKIVTGPIVRYRDISKELAEREITAKQVADGLRRFIIGLAKKILIADQIARVVNPAFALPSPSFSTGIAWLVVLGYTLQLYFDFSGYTDMAIGLGQALGFHFAENFNYPYISKSISEFWRRWHMTLSGWFRDYVFYPLEFSRRRGNQFRQQLNVLIVFLLTGLWHGLTINFAVWGLIHGAAIAVETQGLGRKLKKAWAPLAHVYTLAIVVLGWVFFRSPSLTFAFQLLGRMFGQTRGVQPLIFSQAQPLPLVENSVWFALVLGALLSMPVLPVLRKGWAKMNEAHPALAVPMRVGVDIFLFILLVGSFTALAGSLYVANIYGSF